MSFKSIDSILNSCRNPPISPEQQDFEALVKAWAEIVEPRIASVTRPVSLIRGVLKVAVSSSVWVQELSFKRLRLLAQCNQRVSTPLKDLRFSTVGWESSQQEFGLTRGDVEQHPSTLPKLSLNEVTPAEPTHPQTVFRAWATAMQLRSQHLPLCPSCDSPTPPGELARWGVCAVCAVKTWQTQLED